MEGFFSRTQLEMTRQPTPRQPLCQKCGLLKTCTSPKMPPNGSGKKKIMVIGEAPGELEDKMGKQFVGRAGQDMQRILQRNGIEMFRDCVTLNSIACAPPGNKVENMDRIDYCRPLVIRAIEEHKPRVILLLSYSPLKSIIGYLFKGNLGKQDLTRWRGWKIPCQKWNCWIVATWHPSWVQGYNNDPLANQEFESHVAWACKQKTRPFPDGIPNYDDQLEVIYDSQQAAKRIKEFQSEERVAFDYETTTLHPRFPQAEIVCCSISNGKTSISFLWHGKAIEEMKRIIVNPNIQKLGWNLQFEELWTRDVLGVGIRNAKWDGMIGCHLQDTRGGITSLEFQEFIHLGINDHKAGISKYLESPKGHPTKPNRVLELMKTDLKSLLRYNALDSLIEFMLDQKQMEEML